MALHGVVKMEPVNEGSKPSGLGALQHANKQTNVMSVEQQAQCQLRRRLSSMEEDLAELNSLAGIPPPPSPPLPPPPPPPRSTKDAYVSVCNLDCRCTPGEVADKFLTCGRINRVTLQRKQNAGQRADTGKCSAIVKFASADGATAALLSMNGAEFHQRRLCVARLPECACLAMERHLIGRAYGSVRLRGTSRRQRRNQRRNEWEPGFDD